MTPATMSAADAYADAEKIARGYRLQWSCAGGFEGHSAAARIIADAIAAAPAKLPDRATEQATCKDSLHIGAAESGAVARQLYERLSRALVTSSNDDDTAPGTEGRRRFVERYMAISDAMTFLFDIDTTALQARSCDGGTEALTARAEQAEAQVAKLRAERDGLAAALKPFAEAADKFYADDADTMRPATVQALYFRSARAALASLHKDDQQ